MAQPQGDLQLRIGYWIVSHKQTLRTWWAMSLLSVMFFSILWAVMFFIVYFSQESKLNRQFIEAAQGVGGFRAQASQPSMIEQGEVNVVVRDGASVDLATELTNPNAEWGASTITYHYTVNGVASPAQTAFLNPSAHRLVMQLNAKVDTTTTVQAALIVDNVVWSRQASAALPEPVFRVENPVADVSTVTVNGRTQESVTVRASVTNASVYNFYRVVVPVAVLSGSTIVGVSEVAIERWPTLTTKPLVVTLSYPVSGVSQIRIEPQVSRFDSSNIYR